MSKYYAIIIQFVLPLTTLYRSGAQKSNVYKRDAFVTSWRFHNRAWQPRRHDRLPETSGTRWIHRGALTNQRCSLATGCGINNQIPEPMMTQFTGSLMHYMCITRPHWVNSLQIKMHKLISMKEGNWISTEFLWMKILGDQGDGKAALVYILALHQIGDVHVVWWHSVME